MTSARLPGPADPAARAGREPERPAEPSPRAISFDFGNTLCAVSDEALRTVLLDAAERIAARSGPFAVDEFVAVWREEARRQFAVNVPLGHENDLEERVVRVLARLRGMASPPLPGAGAPVPGWDDDAARRLSDPAEVAAAVRDYGEAFVARMPVDPRAQGLLARLHGSHRLAILSNWPLAWAIDAIAERSGWIPHLDAIVVSQRVGWVKPHPAIFAAVADALSVPIGEILHVGDDWAADVVGAKRAGARAAYLESRPATSPLPSSTPDGSVEPDLVLRDLLEIEDRLPELNIASPPAAAHRIASGRDDASA